MKNEVLRNLLGVECPEPVEGKAFVYLLLCRDQSYYCGSTSNMQNRFEEHQSGEASQWTKTRRPVRLAYCEMLDSLALAYRREKQIKGWTREKKEKLVRGVWN
ncbi:MAG: GIY-YIG nuclease family protein [Candidatus Moraniibacteriota bacterium]